ncbi:Hepatic leukemia factor, partial [Cyphomyrmex costatus]
QTYTVETWLFSLKPGRQLALRTAAVGESNHVPFLGIGTFALSDLNRGNRSQRWSRGSNSTAKQSHLFGEGKQGKDGPEEKKDADGELWGNVEAQAAFLGPNLWDKTLPYDADLKVLNHYVDLDEFLSENGIPVDGVAGGGQGAMQGSQLHKINNTEAAGHQGPAGLHLEPVTKRERSPSPSECCSPDTLNPPSPADSTLSMASSGRDFDPRTRAFSDEELKPQPMIKKSRKQFVPDDLKDDKYWARRRKNNMAAKRSRDARRMKENQIALRAGFLEKEVNFLTAGNLKPLHRLYLLMQLYNS